MLKFTEDHEWLKADGDDVIVGITAHASEQLGDVVFVELPEVGREVAKGEEIVVIESVKAASDIYAPLSGTITDVNAKVIEQPELINQDPYGEGWLFKLTLTDPTEVESLLDSESYEEQLPEEE